jgi:putative hemolysin
MTVFIVSVLAVLIISALCSLLEAALLSLSPSQVADLAARRPRLGALWRDFKSRIERPIAVILIVNTAAHTIGATIAGSQAEKVLGPRWVIPFSLIFTYLVLQFTEILPKAVGVYQNRRLAPIIAYPLAVLIRVFTPVVGFIHLVNRMFGVKRDRPRPEATLEEIASLAALARLEEVIGPLQERIIRGASRLSGLSAREVMIPVDQVAFLSASWAPAEALATAERDAHTRFPVCEEGDADRVVGYVNFKDVLFLRGQGVGVRDLRSVIRPVHFVGPEEPASRLLRMFVEQHAHVAIVRAADGRTLGLVTLEDVIEELVGELEDEFDRLPRKMDRLGSGVWMVGGGVPVQELADRLGLALPGASGTTSAWLLQQFGRTPRSPESLRVDGAEFAVRRVRRGKVFEVAVTVQGGRARKDEG